LSGLVRSIADIGHPVARHELKSKIFCLF